MRTLVFRGWAGPAELDLLTDGRSASQRWSCAGFCPVPVANSACGEPNTPCRQSWSNGNGSATGKS
ncbi:MAG: hypothetical protein ACKO45_08095 [Cyanobium sp.]